MKNNIVRKGIFQMKKVLLPPVNIGGGGGNYLKEKILSGEPFAAARLGAVEIKAMLYSLFPPPVNCLFRRWARHDMYYNAGFFPITNKALKRFALLMLECMEHIDVLASWRIEEVFFKKRLRRSYKITLQSLDPTFSREAWSGALRGKKVLVIHPFAASIERQYNTNRGRLFGEYSDFILPPFAKLTVIKAVQSIAGNTGGFGSWFEALEYMKGEINKADFDVALIGCGAYGFPLAAYVKSIGRQAVHIGGPLQLYFGIKGRRWDSKGWYNEYWVSPAESERPDNFTAVENGCYW